MTPSPLPQPPSALDSRDELHRRIALVLPLPSDARRILFDWTQWEPKDDE